MNNIYLILLSLLVTSSLLTTLLHFMPNMKTKKVRKFWFVLGFFLFIKILLIVLELSKFMSYHLVFYVSASATMIFSLFLIWFLNNYYGAMSKED